MRPVRIGIVGLGEIAREHHVPSIAADPGFVLAAVASRHAQLPGVPSFATLDDMLAAIPDLDAVAVCTPPIAHYEATRLALMSGKHVLLEKPPCSSTAQLEHLTRLAGSASRTLYATWHSHHAAAVCAAERLLRERVLERVQVAWLEDVRRWHPGQQWLREPGGFGVFDAGINALSILTRVLPDPLFARSARLFVPENWAVPIAAELELETSAGVPVSATLDFRHPGPQRWEIDFYTDVGALKLADGGATLRFEAQAAELPQPTLAREYAAIYRRFGELISRQASEVDVRPLQCVADLFLIGRHITVESFLD